MFLNGAALDGQLKHEDTNLASSTLVHDPTQKENLGIIVQYKVGECSFRHFIFLLLLSQSRRDVIKKVVKQPEIYK